MIFEYAGSSGHFQSKILKLKKLSSVSPPSASALCFERPDDFTSVAANHIFGSSFPRHIPSCEYISLDKGLLEALNGLSSLDRPKFRKNVSSIDTNAPYGALMPNLRPPCHSRVMTVEIKVHAALPQSCALFLCIPIIFCTCLWPFYAHLPYAILTPCSRNAPRKLSTMVCAPAVY